MNDQSEEKEKLQSYLEKIAENILYADSSYQLLKSIGENNDKIKKLHLENFFDPLTKVLFNDIILSVHKIYGTDNKIHLGQIQRHLSSNPRTIIIETTWIETIQKYKLINFSDLKTEKKTVTHAPSKLKEFKDCTFKTTYDAFSFKDFIHQLEQIVSKLHKDYANDLIAIKDLRDKKIAHLDKKDVSTRTTWDKIRDLIQFTKEYVDLVSWVYLSRAYSGDNSEAFSLGNTSELSLSFERLLKDIKPIEERI